MRYTIEAMLTQLGYTVNDSVKSQMESIIKNTKNFFDIQKHIVQLNDSLKPYHSYVALSSSKNYLKIKNVSEGDLVAKVDEMIKNWANKYKIALEKVDGKETYYILGKD